MSPPPGPVGPLSPPQAAASNSVGHGTSRISPRILSFLCVVLSFRLRVSDGLSYRTAVMIETVLSPAASKLPRTVTHCSSSSGSAAVNPRARTSKVPDTRSPLPCGSGPPPAPRPRPRPPPRLTVIPAERTLDGAGHEGGVERGVVGPQLIPRGPDRI